MNTVAIIQARIGSSRFPKKILSSINDKPLLCHIIDFLKHAKLINKIVVATSCLPEDDVIEEIAKQMKIDYYRGSSEDVLKRYYDCAKYYKADVVVRITADNPLIDPTIVDQVIESCIKTKCDFASTMISPTFPLGYLVEAMPFSVLETLHRTQKDKQSREHIVFHIRKNPELYNVVRISAPQNMVRPYWRLTVDYKEDLELINKIFSALYNKDSYISYKEVFTFLNNHPELLKINQKYRKI